MSGTPSRRLTVLCLGSAALAGLALIVPTHPVKAEKVGVAAAVKPDAYSEGKQVEIGNSVFYNQRINTTGEGLVQVLLVDGSTFTVGPGSDLVIDKFVYDPAKKQGEVVASFSKGVLRFVGGKISKNEGGVTVNTPSGALAIRGGMFQGTPNLFSFLFGVEMKFTGRNGVVNRVYQPGYTLDLKGGVPTVRPTTADDTAFFMKALAGGGKVVVGGAKTDNPNPGSLFKKKVDTAEITQEGTQNVIIGQLDKEEEHVDNPPPPPPPAGGNDDEAQVRVLQAPTNYTIGEASLDNPGSHGVLGGSDDPDETADDFNMSLDRQGDRLVGVFEVVKGNNDSEDPFQEISGNLNLPAEFEPGACDEFGVCVVTDATLETTVSNSDSEPIVTTETLKGSAVVVGAGFVAYQLFHPLEEFNFASQSDAPSPLALTNNFSYDNEWPSEFLGFQQRIGFAQGLRYFAGLSSGSDLNDPLLIFAGKKFNMNDSGEVRDFMLLTDPRQSIVLSYGDESFENFVVPFATMEASPFAASNTDASVSNLSVLQKDAGDPQSRSVWLQTSLLMKDQDLFGGDQESVVVVALGEMNNNTGLTGNRRGGSSLNVYHVNDNYDDVTNTTEPVSFTGAISTLPGSNGAHFMGDKTPNIVIGADSTGDQHNIFLDKPLSTSPDDGHASATYHVGIGSPHTTPPVQTGGTFNGYAAGIYQHTPGNDDEPVGVLMSNSSDDVVIEFNARRNTLSATLLTHAEDENGQGQDSGGATMVFGDSGDTRARSAFIDNEHYAAIETPGQSSIQHDNGQDAEIVSAPTGYMVSGQQLGVTKFFQDTFGPAGPKGKAPAFCADCAFIKWGAWGMNAGFKDHGSEENNPSHDVTANVHLGWWVAGNIVSATDVDNLQAQGATATYDGHALGTVANRIDSSGWKTYTAAGDMHMGWDFGERSGDLSITHFDQRHFQDIGGLSFSGTMCAPGSTCGLAMNVPSGNHFGGNLSGTNLPANINDVSGFATGSFVNKGVGAGGVANGVIGNWGVGGDAYKATGIFAGSGKPGVPH